MSSYFIKLGLDPHRFGMGLVESLSCGHRALLAGSNLRHLPLGQPQLFFQISVDAHAAEGEQGSLAWADGLTALMP